MSCVCDLLLKLVQIRSRSQHCDRNHCVTK